MNEWIYIWNIMGASHRATHWCTQKSQATHKNKRYNTGIIFKNSDLSFTPMLIAEISFSAPINLPEAVCKIWNLTVVWFFEFDPFLTIWTRDKILWYPKIKNSLSTNFQRNRRVLLTFSWFLDDSMCALKHKIIFSVLESKYKRNFLYVRRKIVSIYHYRY